MMFASMRHCIHSLNQKNYGAMQRKKRPALTEASTWALRDAAANVSFEFHRQQKIKEWLEKY